MRFNSYINRCASDLSSFRSVGSAGSMLLWSNAKYRQAAANIMSARSHATLIHRNAVLPFRRSLQVHASMMVNKPSTNVYRTSICAKFSAMMTNDALASTRYDQSHHKTSNSNYIVRSFWRKAFKPLKPPPSKFNYKIDLEHTLKSLKGIHQHVKNNISLDLWTINLLLLGFVAGPSIYNAMKSSPHTEDDYMFSVPVDDPVEHSVRILMELNAEHVSSSTDEEKSPLKSTFNNPEDDAKRILNDLLASEHLRTTASRIASGVISSPQFQDACKALVRNIWNDLIDDPETNNQLVALVQSVLKNERVYSAVKKMMIQLVNDEEVYKELTKLVVQLGEEKDVLDATQRLLTESTHKTLNDPSVLDHSMEFATEVVGDDVVQRSGGEALRNTLGYAVQPSGGAIIVSLGTMIMAGAIHFYFFRSRGGSIDEGWLSPRPSFDSLSTGSDMRSRSFETSSGGGNAMSTLIQNTWSVFANVVSFPVLFMGSIYNGIRSLCSYPQQAFSKVQYGVNYITTIPSSVLLGLKSIPARLEVSAMSFVSSACAYASSKVGDIQSTCMDCINSTSRTTKGALNYIVSTICASAKSSIASIAILMSSIRNRFTGSCSTDDTQLIQ